jgi:hypothetical protein
MVERLAVATVLWRFGMLGVVSPMVERLAVSRRFETLGVVSPMVFVKAFPKAETLRFVMALIQGPEPIRGTAVERAETLAGLSRTVESLAWSVGCRKNPEMESAVAMAVVPSAFWSSPRAAEGFFAPDELKGSGPAAIPLHQGLEVLAAQHPWLSRGRSHQ